MVDQPSDRQLSLNTSSMAKTNKCMYVFLRVEYETFESQMREWYPSCLWKWKCHKESYSSVVFIPFMFSFFFLFFPKGIFILFKGVFSQIRQSYTKCIHYLCCSFLPFVMSNLWCFMLLCKLNWKMLQMITKNTASRVISSCWKSLSFTWLMSVI